MHEIANVLDKLPKCLQPKAKAALHEMMNAPTKAECEKLVTEFVTEHEAKYPKATKALETESDKLMTHFELPADHWKHLRTTNPIESTFAPVRLRQRVTRGAARGAGLAMAYRLLLLAERSWRRLDGQELLPLVRAGVQFKDGVRAERDDAQVTVLAKKLVSANKEKRGRPPLDRLLAALLAVSPMGEEKSKMDRRLPPLANIVTLGVRNFDAQREFYRRLGWPQAFDSDDFAVFELRGALLALFPVDKLGADAHAEPELGRGGIRFSIIISVDRAEEVDELADRVRQAGGKLTKNPVDAEFFVGRDAYFADPEGNYWEIACGPPDNPVSAASRRAAGLAVQSKRLKPAGKPGQKGKKKSK